MNGGLKRLFVDEDILMGYPWDFWEAAIIQDTPKALVLELVLEELVGFEADLGH